MEHACHELQPRSCAQGMPRRTTTGGRARAFARARARIHATGASWRLYKKAPRRVRMGEKGAFHTSRRKILKASSAVARFLLSASVVLWKHYDGSVGRRRCTQ